MSVAISLVRAVVEVLERDHHIDGRRFLSEAGIDPARLDNVDERVSRAECDWLIEQALAASGNPALGLRVGLTAKSLATGLYAYGVLQAPSIVDGLKFADEFHGLSADERPLTVEIGAQSIIVRATGVVGSGKHPYFGPEVMAGGLYVMLRHFAPNARPDRVAFESGPPPHRHEYARIFQGAEQFEQTFTGIVIGRDLLDVRQWNHDEELHALLRAQAAKKLAKLEHGASYVEKLRDYVTAVPGRPHEMTSVARALGMSPRSLRRRLFEEGATFREVVDPALASVARRLLVDERKSIRDAAHVLAFSQTSAFTRAFKRWTGFTPRQYQSAHSKGPRCTAPVAGARGSDSQNGHRTVERQK